MIVFIMFHQSGNSFDAGVEASNNWMTQVCVFLEVGRRWELLFFLAQWKWVIKFVWTKFVYFRGDWLICVGVLRIVLASFNKILPGICLGRAQLWMRTHMSCSYANLLRHLKHVKTFTLVPVQSWYLHAMHSRSRVSDWIPTKPVHQISSYRHMELLPHHHHLHWCWHKP